MKINLKGNAQTTQVWLNNQELDLKKSLAVDNRSPSGFNWGYGGSGPSQLALAVCLELFGKWKAREVYQLFKDTFIAALPSEKDFDVEIDLTDFLKKTRTTFLNADQEEQEEKRWQEESIRLEEERQFLADNPHVVAEMEARKAEREEARLSADTLARLSELERIRFQFNVPYRPDGICNLIISRGNSIVFASEIHDNPGQSITNAAEFVAQQVCEQFQLNPQKLIWVEHYSSASYSMGRDNEDFDLVKFQIDKEGNFHSPEWIPLSIQEAEEYILLLNDIS